AARRIADATDPFGRRARTLLPESTGLSLQGVELALTRCLEIQPTEAELAALCASLPEVPRAHVSLPANVFVAAHRAIALAAAAAPEVAVRASRREPHLPALLCEASDGAFELVRELSPRSGDMYFAY